MTALLFLYVVSASHDPDRVRCLVPYEVDPGEIFFGPCKKLLRRWLREQYLRADKDLCEPAENIYLVGVNGANARRERKIVWAGRVIKIMTFARAHFEMAGERYQKLREHEDSPLHVAPLLINGELCGYRPRSHLHDDWYMDLIARKNSNAAELSEDHQSLRVRPGISPWKAFPRDACMLCENVFFPRKGGLAINDEVLYILGLAQADKEGIDGYAVFGRSAGRVNGLRGSWLTIAGALAESLVAWIKRHSSSNPSVQACD